MPTDPAAAAEAAAAFAAWDHAADADWAAYAATVEVPDPARWPLVRAKWYRRNVNGALDVDAVRAAAGGGSQATARPPPPPPQPRRAPAPARPTAAAAFSPSLATGALLAADAGTLLFALRFALSGGSSPPAWRRFALAAVLSHTGRLVAALGRPPLDPAALGPSLVAFVPWVVRAGRTTDGALLAFLIVAGRAPSLPAALPAALLSACHGLETVVAALGPAAPAWATRARSALAARATTLARCSAGAELLGGAFLTLGLFSGRAGLWAVLLFWRTYLPFRLRTDEGRHHAALLERAVGAAAGAVGGGSGFGAWLRRVEGGLRERAGAA